MINNVLFDLDGTLLDTSAGILESVRYTAKKMGLGVLSDKQMYSFIGPPLKQSFIREYGCTEEDAEMAVKIFREYYSNGAIFNSKPYDGISELCQMLKNHNYGLAVATNKPDGFAHKLIKNFGIDDYFDSIHGADQNGKLKKADLIALCLDDLRAVPDNCALVGDTDNDAAGAMDAGVHFIAVTYGFGFRNASDVKYPHCIGIANTPIQVSKLIFI